MAVDEIADDMLLKTRHVFDEGIAIFVNIELAVGIENIIEVLLGFFWGFSRDDDADIHIQACFRGFFFDPFYHLFFT